MADWCILWAKPSGDIRVTRPNPRQRLPEEPEGQWLDGIALRTQAANPDLADCTRLPDCLLHQLPGRRFRNCWRHDGGAVKPDAALARQQLLAEVREERDRRLTASDGDKHRLDDIGTATQKRALADYRQALRDLPAVVENRLSMMTVAELEAYALGSREEFAEDHPLWPGNPT